MKQIQRNKTETRTEDKEDAEADNIKHPFPSQKTFRKKMVAFWNTDLTLRHIAKALLNTFGEEVTSYGFDDTKKAAEVRLHDVRTDKIKLRPRKRRK